MQMKALVALAALTGLAACGSDPPPPAQPPPQPVAVAPPPAPPRAPPPSVSQINIDPSIRAACGITDAEAYFAYDSANIRAADQAILKKLADCFTTGPLKGRQMRLVGHADPRGDEEYNRVLGQRRADNVKSGITTAGMNGAKIVTTSRGEDDASGGDETGWQKDRRVDVLLGD